MPVAVNIVLYGRDFRLMETRSWVLKAAGFVVATAQSAAVLKQLLDASPASVLILCHSLSTADVQGILAETRGQPALMTLILEGPRTEDTAGQVDAALRPYEGPNALVSAVERLVKRLSAIEV